MKIWVDDRRPAPAGWALARNYEEAILLFDRYGTDITDVSLDYDLSDAHYEGDVSDCRTGYDVLAVLLDFGLRPSIEFHTTNPGGLQRMMDLLDSYDL